MQIPAEHPADAPLVVVEELVKAYAGKVVLDHVSLHVDRGETLVIVGTSGAGKSTLIRQIVARALVVEPAVRAFADASAIEPDKLVERRARRKRPEEIRKAWEATHPSLPHTPAKRWRPFSRA